MKYEAIAESQHYFDFVFYEVEGKTMYIFCPNCQRVHEVQITKNHTVDWLKRNYEPCECFSYRGTQPQYKRTCYEHAGLNRVISVAEFENRGDGNAALCVYWHKAEFGASNYDALGYPFKRHPIYSDQKVIEILYKNDGTVSIETSLFIPMCSRFPKIGEWRQAKKWRPSTFEFDIISESYEQLKGTVLEQYLNDIDRFRNTTIEATNIESQDTEIIAVWLMQMHINTAVKRLWKAGYSRLVFNKTIETMIKPGIGTYYYGDYAYQNSNRVINYRGKTLEKILKIAPQKFDLVEERQTATVEELSGAQRVSKIKGVDVNLQNVQIAVSYRYDDLVQIFTETEQPFSKMFKYIRHEANKNGGGYNVIRNIVIDYYDYLYTLKKLNTPFTKDIVFPVNMTKSHDAATKILRDLTVELKDKAFIKAIKEYTAFAFSDGRFKIDVVKTATQLKKEADKMHNCSAGYIDKIIDGNAVIFLIRRTEHPRKPFYMLEYNPNKHCIVQNRGINNVAADQEVQAFAEMWLRQIVKPHPTVAKSA